MELNKEKNEKYFVIQNELMEMILKALKYEEFIKLIGDKIDERINEYKNLNLENENNYNKYFEELMLRINNDYSKEINTIIDNNSSFYNNINSSKLTELKENEKAFGDKKIHYYNNLAIINNIIRNIILNIFKIKLGEEVNIIQEEKKIIMKLLIKEKKSIMVGICEQNIFKTEIVLYFNNVEDPEEYFLSIKPKWLLKQINNYFNDEQGISVIKNDKIDIGFAYKIDWVNKDIKKINNNKILSSKKNNFLTKDGKITIYWLKK